MRAKFERGLLPLVVSLFATAAVFPASAQQIDGQTRVLGPSYAQAEPQAQSQAQPALSNASTTAPTKTAKKGAKKEKKVAETEGPQVSDAKPMAPNSTVNLINLLVKQGVIDDQQAQELIKQAEDENYVSREANKDASEKADEAAKAANDAAQAALPPGTRHVTYVPEIVKKQLRDELRKEVMEQAQKEGWASPGAYPEWAQRIHFYGDMRLRYERVLYPTGNAPQTNFNAINTGSPYDVSQNNEFFPPVLDTTEDRTLFRVRARVGMEAQLDYGITANIRLATGDTAAPVSTNATFGSNGGDFSKYAIWLDRASIKYDSPDDSLRLLIGRFDNPFWSPTDLVWYSELGFDGIAGQVRHEILPGITPFAAAGAFPIFNTSLNTSYTVDVNPNAVPAEINTLGAGTNVPSDDKYLFGGQFGVNASIGPDYNIRVAAAYYDFTHVQGEVSDPCAISSTADVCSTDLSRPSYAQFGNSYFELRNLNPTIAAQSGSPTGLYEYFGLASAFRPLVGSAQIDFANFRPIHIILDGEYVRNTAFNINQILSAGVGTPQQQLGPVNNLAANTGVYDGGNQGFMTRLTVGNPEVKHLWDWNAFVAYKYLESDATLDAFVDPDFGLGGTNLKGYIVGYNLGLAENLWTTVKWMSANNIAGSPYDVDVLLIDLNGKF
jgi:hypothetical protein